MSKITVAIAADHAGYALKEAVKQSLPEYQWVDLGTTSEESVDYPDYGKAIADYLTGKGDAKGIIICGSGIGISIACNRYPHVRAALCGNSTMALVARAHNDANVLALGARITGLAVALDCVRVFLDTPFEGGRHRKRVDQLCSMC